MNNSRNGPRDNLRTENDLFEKTNHELASMGCIETPAIHDQATYP